MSNDTPVDAPTMLRLEEANRSAATIVDVNLRNFVRFGLTTVLLRRGMDPSVVPTVGFDLRFFVEALRAIGEDQATLLAILRGESTKLEWWSDDD